MKKLSKFNKGILSGFLAVLCFSMISTLGIKVYGAGVSPLGVLTFRAFSAGFLFFMVILLSKKISFKIAKEDIGKLVLHSSILAIHLILFWQGLKMLHQVSTTLALYFTFPLWVCLIAILFLKERMSKRKIVSLFMGMIGVLFTIQFLPSLSFAGINLVGVMLMLLAAIAWATCLILGQTLLKKYHLFTILFYNFLFCLVVFSLLQNPIITFNQITLSVSTMFYIAIMGIVSTFLSYLFLYYAVGRIRASNMSIINLSQPLISALIAFLVLSQIINWTQAIGMGLILISVYLLPKKDEQ